MTNNNNNNDENSNSNTVITDIEDLFHKKHNEALNLGERTYIDPETGFTVFTELIHLKRGKCCGNKCRHCPYGYEKVKGYGPAAGGGGNGGGGYRRRRNRTTATTTAIDSSTTSQPQPTRILPKAPIAKLRSGDIETAEKMVQEIMKNAEKERQKLQLSPESKFHSSSSSSSLKKDNKSKKVVVHKEEEDDNNDDDILSTTSSSSTVSSTDTNSGDSSSNDSSNSCSDSDSDSSDVIDNAETTSAAKTMIGGTVGVVVAGTTIIPPLSSTTITTATPTIITATTTTTKNVPYTRTGDQGTSQLGTGERRSKTDDAFEAMGTVDELCSFVGVAHAYLLQSMKIQKQQQQQQQTAVVKTPIIDYGDLSDRLLDIMSRLFDVGSHVAKPPPDANYEFRPNGIGDGFDPDHVDDLEEWINEMTEELPELTSFILPTGSIIAAQLHVARTVCRRAERKLVPLVVNHKICDPNSLQYLNRFSDFFFVSSRWINYKENQDEIEYRLELEYSESEQRERIHRSPLLVDDNDDGGNNDNNNDTK
jgi:cob(I)alamin adenosyltransferase